MMAIHRLSVRPRSLIVAAMACAAVGSYASAQNTLTAGDVAVIGMIANGSPDSFAFVNLVDLPAGTQIYFVDNGWNPSLTPAGFRGVSATDGDGNENLQRLNVTGLIPAGTIISSSASGANYSWAAGTVAGTTATYTVPSFSQEGEQVYAFQSSDPSDNPLFTGGPTPAVLNHIFVFDDTNGFEDGVNTNSGNVPPGLTLGNTAITFNLASPVKVFNTASLTSGTKADWLNAISNAANWSQASSGALPTGTISVVAPSIPSINGVSFSGGPNFAGGQNVTFTVSLTGAPASSPATIQITSSAFVAPVTVSINAPATSGMATATLAPVTGSPQVFSATATAVSNSTGGATSSSFTVYPAASATASPAAGVTVASVGATHTVSATVLAGSVPASNVLVNFQIVSGPNAPQSLSATTNSQGVASVMYNSNGQAGLDTISISGNVSGNGFATSATQSWAAAGPFFLTELMINSPGTDQGSESIELKGPASTTLAGYSIIVIEGDTGNAGTVDKVIPLSALTTGTNGLLLLRDTESVLDPAPDSATTVFVSDFDPDIENDGNTILLGYGATPALNSDLDTNNDGTIDASALAGFIAVDAIAYYNGDTGGVLYGDDFGAVGINLAQDVPNDPDGWTPDQLTRILNPNGGPCAWAASDIFGSFPGPYTFALNEQLGFASNGFIAVGAMQMSLGSMNISSPAILNAPVAVAVNNGDSATLSVTGIATGYQWRRNGQNLSDNGTISGAHTRDLTINPAGAANQGNYDVVLTSPCGSITTVAVALTVQGGGCTADTNNSGTVTADDIFAFLDAWFAQNGQTGAGLTADFNQSQSVTADDIFAFLDAWFAQNGSSCN